ncbi:hypothetical protein X798_06343, partial [Onchocerca flexuosa]
MKQSKDYQIGMLITEMLDTRKYENGKVTFGVRTLSGNVKNFQPCVVHSVSNYIGGNEKLEKEKWGNQTYY